jgi:hypothetical protein
MRPTKEKLNLKKNCEKKNGTVGGKIKGRGKLTDAAFCRLVDSNGPLIP